MNREIKFRGYATGIGWVYGSLVNNLWTYSELSANEKGSPVFEIITGKYDGSCWTDVAEEEGEAIVSVVPQSVGQFTGLLDKNGKEIYEGDIINTVTGKPMVIGWSKRFASFTIERDGWAFKHFFGEAMESNDIEVIGNIFENPNLLNP